MLQDFHFKIVHRPGSKHSNVDALSRNPIFVSNEAKDFQVEIPDDAKTISKIVIESGDRSLHDKTKIHDMQNIFTLSKATKERLEQLVEKNSQDQTQEFNPKKIHLRTLLIYFKHNLSTIDYEQMVREVQQLVDEKMKFECANYVFDHEKVRLEKLWTFGGMSYV